jgi:ammonia channel protein AmtB
MGTVCVQGKNIVLCRLLKGSGGDAVKFLRVLAFSSITGCLSAGLLSHPLFGGAQSSVVFSTQAVVQALCAVLVAAWAALGTLMVIGLVHVLFQDALLPEDGTGADVELVG